MPQNVQLVRAQLEREGFQVSGVQTGAACLQAIRHELPDLVVLDALLPEFDGYEVCRQLKEDRATRHIPVIMLTALTSQADKVRALEAGADDFLTKPVDRSELLARVRAHLRTRQLYHELSNSRDEVRTLNEQLEARVAERTEQLEEALKTLATTQERVVQQERLRALGEMASGIAHDFNNALAPVVGFSELLLRDRATREDPERLLGYLNLISAGANGAAAVVGRLREFYRAREAGEHVGEIHLAPLIEQTVALTQPKWRDQALGEGKSVRVETELSPVAPVAAGHEAELRDALTNLLFNAVDAIPRGASEGRVTIRTYERAGDVVIEVADNGSGMSTEVQRRCLEPFFSTKGDRGTGLGLSTVYGMVRRNGGSVEIESAIGTGTTIRLVLHRAERGAQGPTGVPEDESFQIVTGLRILVVDDQVSVRRVTAAYLDMDEHEVVEAADGEEALDYLQSESFDIVLTDWAMPGMTGDQLAAAVKQLAPSMPVVVVTGFGETLTQTERALPNVDAIVSKPVTLSALRRVLVDVQGLKNGALSGARVDPAS